MEAFTHLLGTGYRCTRCGEQIPRNPLQKGWQIGDSIGLLTSKHTNPVSYAVGNKDTNPQCSPSASEGTGYSPSINSKGHSTTSASDAG